MDEFAWLCLPCGSLSPTDSMYNFKNDSKWMIFSYHNFLSNQNYQKKKKGGTDSLNYFYTNTVCSFFPRCILNLTAILNWFKVKSYCSLHRKSFLPHHYLTAAVVSPIFLQGFIVPSCALFCRLMQFFDTHYFLHLLKCCASHPGLFTSILPLLIEMNFP